MTSKFKRWLIHLLKQDRNPARQPPDSEKAHRFMSADREPVLGWRPAIDQVVPGTGWVLERKLGEGGFGEVWLGRDKRLKTERSGKPCIRGMRITVQDVFEYLSGGMTEDEIYFLIRRTSRQRKHRAGLLTLLFTDIIDSAKLKQSLGDRVAVPVIQRHHALLREILGQFSEGEEIETAGDSFFIVFTKPSDAVKFSLLVQARLRVLSAEVGRPVFDRIGIHVGEVWIEEQEGGGKARISMACRSILVPGCNPLEQADQILYFGDSDMSRSRRKRPFVGITTAQSEKQDKREANRSLRRAVKAAVRAERETVPEIREVANVYSFAKDGRRRFNPRGHDSKWMRK